MYPVWSAEEGFRQECIFGNYWSINAVESQESKHDHQRVSVDGEETTKDSALESSSSEPQKSKSQEGRSEGAPRKTAEYGEPASKERG